MSGRSAVSLASGPKGIAMIISQNDYNKMLDSHLPIAKNIAQTEYVRRLPLRETMRLDPRTVSGKAIQGLFMSAGVGVYEADPGFQGRVILVAMGTYPLREQNGTIRRAITPHLNERFKSIEEVYGVINKVVESGIHDTLVSKGIVQLSPMLLQEATRSYLEAYRKTFNGSNIVSANDLYDAFCLWNALAYMVGVNRIRKYIG